MSAFVTIFFTAGFLAVTSLWRGFVLSKVWLWLLIPVFPMAPVLGLAHAIGISLVVTFLTHQLVSYKGQELDSSTNAITAFVFPMIVLTMAAVVKQFY